MLILRRMFKYLARQRAAEPLENDIISIPNAIVALQESTGMTRAYLGKRLGMTHTQMVNLESRGKPVNSALLLRLKQISEEHTLYRIAAYFDNQEILSRAHRRKNFKETTGK